jgi:hypothetical protein
VVRCDETPELKGAKETAELGAGVGRGLTSGDRVAEMPDFHPIRVVCATRGKTGRAGFNQVVLGDGPPPRGLLLVAIYPDEGLRLWMKPFSVLEPYTKAQHGSYSRNLNVSVDNPPDYLGEPVRISRNDVDQTEEGLFQKILGAQTNTKNKLVRELFGF